MFKVGQIDEKTYYGDAFETAIHVYRPKQNQIHHTSLDTIRPILVSFLTVSLYFVLRYVNQNAPVMENRHELFTASLACFAGFCTAELLQFLNLKHMEKIEIDLAPVTGNEYTKAQTKIKKETRMVSIMTILLMALLLYIPNAGTAIFFAGYVLCWMFVWCVFLPYRLIERLRFLAASRKKNTMR